jgi:hypothetical protein
VGSNTEVIAIHRVRAAKVKDQEVVLRVAMLYNGTTWANPSDRRHIRNNLSFYRKKKRVV